MIEFTARQQRLIAAVRNFAQANYATSGWDYVVECWEDADIAEVVGRARNASSAIDRVRKVLAPAVEVRTAITAEADREIAIHQADMQAEAEAAQYIHHYCPFDSFEPYRTKIGKVGRWTGLGYEPGWSGVIIASPGYCDGDPGECHGSPVDYTTGRCACGRVAAIPF